MIVMNSVLYNQVISKLQIDNGFDIKAIRSVIDIYGAYHKKVKNSLNLNKNVFVESKLILDFLSQFGLNNIVLSNDKYLFSDSLLLVVDKCNILYNKTIDERKIVIFNSLNNLILLLFKDYLKENDKKFIKIVKFDNIERGNKINDKLLLVSERLDLIDLYNNNKLNQNNILKIVDRKVIDYVLTNDLNADYLFLYSNLLCDLLYNDSDRYEKISYLISLLNNTKDMYFKNLEFSCILNVADSDLCINDDNGFKYKLILSALFLSGTSFLFVININSVTSLNKVCDKRIYNNNEASICINSILDNNVLREGIVKENIDLFSEKTELLDNSEIRNKIDMAYEQLEEIENVKKEIQSLFVGDTVKDDVTINERYNLYNSLIKIKQTNFVEENMKYVDLIDEAIYKNEFIELKEVPFISQKEAEIYNGCEASSLLMALQYKNKLLDYDLKKFVEEVPKHKYDPHQGFIHSIYDYAPRDVVHWIAPDALSRFALNYGMAEDISGSDVEDLKGYIRNNTPVIVYVTANFKEANFTEGEVPLNLHVVLLIGYNQVNGDYVIIDPYYGRQEIEASAFEKSYNILKYGVAIY